MTTAPPATATSRIMIGGDLPVRRLGYGTMQLTGPGHWDLPRNPDNAIAVLRTAVHELGITRLDTADAYGPHTVETLIRQALHPYPDDVVIATKGGLARPGPNVWRPCGRPDYLQQCVELSLRRLGVDCLDLYYLHRIDPQVPLADQLGVLAELRQAGKSATSACPKSPSTRYAKPAPSPTSPPCRTSTSWPQLTRSCRTANNTGWPTSPTSRSTPAPTCPTPTQILQTLLQRSPAMVVIPGTASVGHLRANCAADQSTAAQTDGEKDRS